VVEDPLGDLIFVGPPHVVVVAQPGQDAVQYADPGGVPGQALVRADDIIRRRVAASAYS